MDGRTRAAGAVAKRARLTTIKNPVTAARGHAMIGLRTDGRRRRGGVRQQAGREIVDPKYFATESPMRKRLTGAIEKEAEKKAGARRSGRPTCTAVRRVVACRSE